MTVEIHIDYRESTLIGHVSTTVPVKELNLELGDVQIVDTDHGINLVFERKTLTDLSASLKDGRYKEQKHRILSHYQPKHVTYIIEGGSIFPTDKYGLTSSVYDGMYMHSMYRDGIHVVFVADVAETAKLITNVATKIQQNPAKFLDSGSAQDYVASCKAKSKKCDNVTPETCYIMQLCQIPGVSIKIAKTIQEKYKSMWQLMQALAAAAEPCDILSQLPMIGSKKAKVIVSFLLA